jgi:hypothetical protein
VSGPSTRLRLRVSPRSSRPGVLGQRGEAWAIRVRAPAEGGRANAAALALLADALEVPRARLELVAGATSRDKVVEVEGLTASEVASRLAASAEGQR